MKIGETTITRVVFKEDLIKALKEGRKTIFFYSMAPQPVLDESGMWHWKDCHWSDEGMGFPKSGIEANAPYHPGSLLYVGEPYVKLYAVDSDGYTHYDQPMYYYAADGKPDIILRDEDGFEEDDQTIRWENPLFMPLEAARFFLRITGVGVKRLQSVTVEELIACGIDIEPPPICKKVGPTEKEHEAFVQLSPAKQEEYIETLARHTYMGWCNYVDELFQKAKATWDSDLSLTGRKMTGWDVNPWIYVYKFEKLDKEEPMNGFNQKGEKHAY